MSVLAAENVSVQIAGKNVVRDVSAAVSRGELVGLVGPNGAGKTSLLRAMCRLLKPSGGRVLFDGKDISSFGNRDFATRVSYLPQGHLLHWRLDVAHLVGLGRMPHRGPFGGLSDRDVQAVSAAMQRTELSQFADRDVSTLSGGERSRAMLARVLAVEADLILADEPVAALDPYHALHVMELLRDLAREGRGILAVLHDLSLAMRFCDRLILMNEGRVLHQGLPADVLAGAPLGESYGVRGHYGAHENERYVVPWRRLKRSSDGKLA